MAWGFGPWTAASCQTLKKFECGLGGICHNVSYEPQRPGGVQVLKRWKTAPDHLLIRPNDTLQPAIVLVTVCVPFKLFVLCVCWWLVDCGCRCSGNSGCIFVSLGADQFLSLLSFKVKTLLKSSTTCMRLQHHRLLPEQIFLQNCLTCCTNNKNRFAFRNVPLSVMFPKGNRFLKAKKIWTDLWA